MKVIDPRSNYFSIFRFSAYVVPLGPVVFVYIFTRSLFVAYAWSKASRSLVLLQGLVGPVAWPAVAFYGPLASVSLTRVVLGCGGWARGIS